jgi:hypothetical protein
MLLHPMECAYTPIGKIVITEINLVHVTVFNI